MVASEEEEEHEVEEDSIDELEAKERVVVEE